MNLLFFEPSLRTITAVPRLRDSMPASRPQHPVGDRGDALREGGGDAHRVAVLAEGHVEAGVVVVGRS